MSSFSEATVQREVGQQDAATPLSEREMALLQTTRPVPRISINAFCETEGVLKPIERAADDRRLARAHLDWQLGGIKGAVEHYGGRSTPNLLIVESRARPEKIMTELQSLAEVCDPSTKVVVIGHYNDVALYRDMVRNGISEYIVAPITMADLITTIEAIFSNSDSASPLGRTIAFIGAKGGVGSSTFAHNTAWAISSQFQDDVVLADMDLPFGTANINFDQDPPQGIAEAVFAPERVDETYLDRLLAKCSERLSLLAAPSTLDRAYDLEEEAFSTIIETIQATTPVVVLDIPHSWNAWTRSVLQSADEVVIVSTPELANLRNTKNLVDTLKKLRPNDPLPRLIVNQTNVPKRPEIDPYDFAEPLGIEPLAIVPFDPALFGTASNNGQMLSEMDGDHATSRKVNEIAHILTGRAEVKGRASGGLFGMLKKLRSKS